MATDAIITAHDLGDARKQLYSDGLDKIVDTLNKTEPELYGFLLAATHCVAGRLALVDVSHDIIRQTSEDLLEAALTVLIAMRLSQSRLWDSGGENDINNSDKMGRNRA